MKHRYLFAGFIVAVAAVVATTFVRCEFPALGPFTFFSYIPHERPRVFVSHHPIRALPGSNLTIRLAPDLRPEDGAIVRAVAGLRRGSAEGEEKECAPQSDGTFSCVFSLPVGDADFIYHGRLELAGGARVDGRASYRFTATAAFGSDRLIILREPVVDVPDLQSTYRVDTAWVRDPMRDPAGTDHYSEAQFTADIETGVYNGILDDPIYRWRDDQLGFYLYSDPGFTSSYYSGFDTRCGQNPWPAETAFRSKLDRMATVGVLHRNSDPSGLEGAVPSDPPPTARTFRNCAGNAVKDPEVRTFSVTGGATETARIAKHEFGHAAFGLGDEYPESADTRRVAAASSPPLNDPDCCCDSSSDNVATRTEATASGAGGVVEVPGGFLCVHMGGGVVPGFGRAPLGLPPCTNPPRFPMPCGASPQGDCPTLAGNCLQPQMWLGQAAPADVDTARPNVFASKAACEAGRANASTHPGVEDRERGLGQCRELCGPNTSPCPCGEAEAWIVDTNPAAAPWPGTTPPDSMARVVAARHGSTCAWCVETSLCVRWMRAQGHTADAAWNYCKAPPQDAAERERRSITLLRAFLEWLQSLFRNWRF